MQWAGANKKLSGATGRTQTVTTRRGSLRMIGGVIPS